MRSFYLAVLILLLATASPCLADCENGLELHGSVQIAGCSGESGECIPAAEAAHTYFDAAEDDDAIFTVALHGNPWRFYDGELRILTVRDLARMIAPQLDESVERVLLLASWSGAAPSPGFPSLAEQLSENLDGFPVSGQDGFLWVAPDGSTRTTQQAFTSRIGNGPYEVKPDAEVLVSLVAGWPVVWEQRFVEARDGAALMQAGAGWDIFHLCPDRALATFEAAAGLGNAVAAYDAALIHLAREDTESREKAMRLLKLAEKLGEPKARASLEALGSNAPRAQEQ